MKTLLISLAVLLIMTIPSSLIAEEVKESKARHSVTIEIVYNSVTTEEANRITNAARFTHEEACNCKVSTKKHSNFITTSDVTWSVVGE